MTCNCSGYGEHCNDEGSTQRDGLRSKSAALYIASLAGIDLRWECGDCELPKDTISRHISVLDAIYALAHCVGGRIVWDGKNKVVVSYVG